MPRKSPRSRSKPTPARMPGPGRPRTKPGESRSTSRAGARSAGVHGGRGLKGETPAPRAGRPRLGIERPRATGSIRRVSAPPQAPRGRGRFRPPEPERVQAILAILARLYPEATTELAHENALQLLVATILSAQCTDERVNLVTPGLFARYPDAAALAGAEREALESVIRSTGFFRMKAKAIQSCAADIVSKHGGDVPRTLEALIALRGVGRKTANVVLGNAFGIPGLVVDTHVGRLAIRLGLTRERDPVKVEFALMSIVPRDRWTIFSHWLILHGRRICIARKPRCSICPLLPHCPRIGVTTSQ